MFKRIALTVLIFMLGHCVAGQKARGQQQQPPNAMPGCPQKITTWWFPNPIPPGWFDFAAYPGTFVYLIAAQQSLTRDPNSKIPCEPANAKDETCPFCLAAGHPISLSTGNTFIKQNDITLPGLGGGLNLTRIWISVWPSSQSNSSVGLFGQNWRSTYEERIFMGSDKYLKYQRGDGSYWSFALSPSGTLIVVAPANVAATLTQNATSWVLAFQNGEQRQFSIATGLLTAIIDRNGNTTQLTYDASSRLTTVTDPASRHLYFNYPNGSSYYVSSVTSDFGPALSYTYSDGLLSMVTEPDLTTISFTYSGPSQITQVTDQNGIVLESHTYDGLGHGLSSSQANGVNSLTVTAPQ